MASGLKLIAGLGNPGSQYEKTRHNAGFWFVDALASQFGVQFKGEAVFQGELARFDRGKQAILLLKPATFMNHSGRSVACVARYLKLEPDEILVVHDELEFLPGVVKLKVGGGHGGHNGLRDIIAHMGSPNFARLRIGIGRPVEKNHVSQYVLDRPGKCDSGQIASAIDRAMSYAGDILDGNIQNAMKALNSG